VHKIKAFSNALWTSEQFRFLVIGGFNTVFGLAVFYLLQALLGQIIGYLAVLILDYIIALVFSFALYKIVVFKSTGNIPMEFLKFSTVYFVPFIVNLAALPFLVEVVGWQPSFAQTVIVFFSALTSYIGHRYFSFRNKTTQNKE
jgi:putative flippase GtrA